MGLDLTDIQGNLLRGYRLPFACYLHVNFGEAAAARSFLDRLASLITSAETWGEGKPARTVNIALSRSALEALALPRATINSFPVEFLDGMAGRSRILRDVGPSDPVQWDPVWRGRVDLSVAINALSSPACEGGIAEVMGVAEQTRGATLAGRQDAGTLIVGGAPAQIEHFGFTDASLSRQFELVQQQWVNYGDDFGLGEDRDPVVGNNRGSGRFVIPGDVRRRDEPFVCSGLPSFVTVKGGDYFFIPSLTALRLLAAGLVDPR